jgi:hypothetical protein
MCWTTLRVGYWLYSQIRRGKNSLAYLCLVVSDEEKSFQTSRPDQSDQIVQFFTNWATFYVNGTAHFKKCKQLFVY